MDRFFVLRGFFLNGQGRLEAKDLPSLQRLGRGLSGFVYETTWEGNRYARKDFPIGVHHSIFQKEARLLLGINHPNIVKCYGYTLGQSSCSLLQEFVDDNIQDAIRRRIEAQMKSAPPSSDEASSSEMPRSRRIVPFEESEAVAITSQIASGMQYLHEQGVAHGDLKPRNLLAYLNSDACELIVKVADFGFVQTKRQIKLASKRARQYDGLMWKAPELFDELQLDLSDPDNSDEDLDDFDDDEVQEEVKGKGAETAVTFLKSRLAMADVYSFGLTCSHILGGRLWSPELSLFELREQRRKEFIPDLSSFNCPDYLKFIIGLCLEVTPSKRPTFSTICSVIDLYRSFPQLFRVMKGAMERVMTKGYGFEDMLSTVTTLRLKDCYEDSSGELYELTCLPHGIGKLKALETLDVSGCSNLEELPKEIGNLTSLTSLILSECSKLKGLSLGIMKSVPLKTLDVRGCSNLNQFSGEIGNMTTLTRVKGLLHVIWKLILNSVVFLWKMCDIKLEKNGNQSLLGLPREIISLEVLNMKGCGKLTSLPHSFGSFKKLRDLNLKGSGIQSLPESFGELSSLEVLNMKNCGKLTSLPHSFGSLKKLRDLNLEESGIQSLPKSFGELSSLEVLNLKGCGKLTSPPHSSGSLMKLQDFDREESETQSLPESRLDVLDSPTSIEQLAKLVKMFNLSPAACQPQLAIILLNFVMELPDKTDTFEIEKTGVVDALMGLLKVENQDCQQDALLALYILSPRISIQTGELPCQTILNSLCSTRPRVREAAVELLDLMVAKKVVDAKMFMETPGALKYTLGMLKKSPGRNEGPQSSASALLKLATEDGDDSVRLGILNDGLDILIKYVHNSGYENFKKLLATMLSLMCRVWNGPNLEAVTEGGGHFFLVTCLRENILKETAARGLLSLIRGNWKTRESVLKANFVAIAVDSVEQRFASADIALALGDIFATSEALEHIYASKKGVHALLVLLEHCPELEGKGAAAAVIAKLYPRLNRAADDQRQTELTGACSHLLNYLDLEDKSQLKMFLRALAAFATGRKGMQMIYEERGFKPLIKCLKNNESDIEVQGLMLKILAEMSCVFTEVDEIRDFSHRNIMIIFLENNISELLCILPESGEFNKHTENMKNLLILIRNFSMAGQAAITQLSEYRAVTVLLKVLKQHEHVHPVSVLTELAVKALEKFMDEPSGKQAFMKGGGIPSLVAVLKLQAPRGSEVKSVSEVKSFTITILSTVARDPDTCRSACNLIFSSDKDLFLWLNIILYDGESSGRCKWQAAALMKLLAMYGPRSKVCSAMHSRGSLEALKLLRDVSHCREIANDVLKYVRAQSKECKKTIDSWNR